MHGGQDWPLSVLIVVSVAKLPHSRLLIQGSLGGPTIQFIRENRLCHYRYDPLDRLVECEMSGQANSRRFYLMDRLATETQGAMQCTIMRHEEQLLAQHHRQNQAAETRLLATDQQRSVLNVLDANRRCSSAYTAYGHRPRENGVLGLLGFSGERRDPVTGHYLLGNGYRGFNPTLMRFNSPDSWSPFGAGGVNAYTYCEGDPVNCVDPTGHSWAFVKGVLRSRGLVKNSMQEGVQNRVPRLPFHSITPNTAPPIRVHLGGAVNISPDTKTPAWTTRDTLAFAGTEARHPGAPRDSISSAISNSQRSSLMSPTAIHRLSTNTAGRARRGAVTHDQLYQALTHLIESDPAILIGRVETPGLIDQPPSYNQASGLPSYDAAIIRELVTSNHQRWVKRARRPR